MREKDPVPQGDGNLRLTGVNTPDACPAKRQADLIASAFCTAAVITKVRVDIRIAMLWPCKGRKGERI